MKKKCLVLGASGFIGKNLCYCLDKKGYSVKAFDFRNLDELSYLEDVELVYGNILEICDFESLLDGVDIVYYLICSTIPQEGTIQIPMEIENNLIPLVKLMENMIKCGVYNLVFASSAGAVYGDDRNVICDINHPLRPISSYGVLKAVSESYILFYNRVYGSNFKVARLSNPYGLGQGHFKNQGIVPIFIDALLNNKTITVWGDGKNVRNYLYIDDAVEALQLYGEYAGDNKIINISSSDEYSINQIIAIIEKTVGLSFKKIEYVAERYCDVRHNSPSNELAIRELNWFPRTDFFEGVKLIYQKMNGETKY